MEDTNLENITMFVLTYGDIVNCRSPNTFEFYIDLLKNHKLIKISYSKNHISLFVPKPIKLLIHDVPYIKLTHSSLPAYMRHALTDIPPLIQEDNLLDFNLTSIYYLE